MAEQNNENRNVETAEDMSELLKIRRQKLADLQAAGKDPFTITKYDQTHHTDEVKALYEALEAKKLAGRATPNTDGLDEAEARAVKKADYEERRAIMDAEPIQVSIAGRLMFKRVMGKASFCNL
ncbi:MAG: lysine--tRNA ligase, partial [Lachnospiraceae bacterium]|nr:lysine--tRNA ligase [Lachnospiraceae bacterium]